MDVNTGHLMTDEEFQRQKDSLDGNYEQVPSNMTASALLELMGKEETMVGEHATSKIATWARKKRKQRKANKFHCS